VNSILFVIESTVVHDVFVTTCIAGSEEYRKLLIGEESLVAYIIGV